MIGRSAGPLLLSRHDKLPASVQDYVTDWNIKRVFLFGGNEVLGPKVFQGAAQESVQPIDHLP